ncbi:hypothetical protein [Dactylosporangium sp. NPDC049140]|uniref:hypothetical protein n=1 Tax=Dactylosporangium sp. NPDC049140 TaxID=3155647 RepID=UPI0033D5DB3A
MSARDEVQPLPGWLAWPIRVLAVIFVVPFKLAWDAFAWVMRVLWKYVGAPIAEYVLIPFLHYVIWIPLRWITVHILWTPLVWFAKYVLVPVAQGIWWLLKATAPFWNLLGRVLLEVGRAVAWAMGLVYRYLLTPIGKAIAFVWRWVVVPIGKAIAFLWRWVVVPIGMAIAWAWNHSVVLLWRYLVVIPLRFVWRYVVVPPARWVHTWVLRPVADTTRRVLVTLGLREAPRVTRRGSADRRRHRGR